MIMNNGKILIIVMVIALVFILTDGSWSHKIYWYMT